MTILHTELTLSRSTHDETILKGPPDKIHDRVVALVLDGWIPFLHYGVCRVGCSDFDEVKMHLLRPKQGKTYVDPDKEIFAREG